MLTEPLPPAIDAAMRKAAVLWLTVPGAPPFPVWPLWHDGALYVLHGGQEQAAPGLAGAHEATVDVPAKGARELVLRFRADVQTLTPASLDWETIVALLLPKRLNLRKAAAGPARWAAESCISRLVPAAAAETREGADPRTTPA